MLKLTFVSKYEHIREQFVGKQYTFFVFFHNKATMHQGVESESLDLK